MKKNILYSSVLIASAAMVTGCSENAWNDHLDGFQSGFNYTEKVTVSYTLTNSDYETIGKALQNVAKTEEEIAAAKAIQANHYFDQSSVYPAQVAVPYLLDDTSSEYFIYTNGSVVEASFRQADEVPAEVSSISSAYTYTISKATAPGDIPGMLKDKYGDAEEGDYAIVSYLDASSAAATTPASTVKAPAKNSNTTIKSRATRADSPVWTVSNALAKMADGYTGEATVIGTITQIDDISTSYGNATYHIGDLATSENTLEVFRGYSLDGEKFTSDDEIAVGNTVIVSGNLTIYNDTYEFNSGSSIITKYEDPINSVASARSAMTDGFTGSALVMGIISEISDLSTSYGNATYFIKDNLTDETDLEVFRGYYLNGDKFTSEDQLEVGATVVVEGNLTIYNGTYEINTGSKILSYSTSNSSTGYDNLTSNIKDLAVGDVLDATAVVSGQCSRGLILTDNAGSILYYNTAVSLADYPIGTVVDVAGEISFYNKGLQLSNTATLTVVETIDYNYPAPVEYTGEMVTEACAGTENMLAQYVTLQGVVTFSGNYLNVEIPGTEIVGSIYYITDDLKAELVSGSNYQLYGYFTAFTDKYFYIVLTGMEEIVPDVDPYDLTNAIYYFDGSNWAVAEGATVLNPNDYVKLGFTNNNLSDPEIYLPMYMKQAFPYALAGDEMFVAYNLKTNSASCDVLVYDGSAWKLNNNNLQDVTAAFTKNDGNWNFTKYLGVSVFNLFEESEILYNRQYMFVSSSGLCANAVLASNSYGYLLTTAVSISGNQITMPNENNAFTFWSTYTAEDGTVYNAPDGCFFIQDSNGRFMYLQGTYSSFNVSDLPLAGSGTTADNYSFTAELNDDSTWTITSKFNGRIIYFSSKYTNFAAYDTQSADDSLPYLYLMD